MLKRIAHLFAVISLLLTLTFSSHAKELAGVTVDDQIELSDGSQLVLNGMGLREKLWIDVYVGSLYLEKQANNVAAVLAQPGAMRIQIDVVYKEMAQKKMLQAWKAGFENNQSEKMMEVLHDRIETFYGFFTESAKKDDQYLIDYIPEQGTSISKNGQLLGSIEGADFKSAILEIWLGNAPVDKQLKRGMLGLE